MSKTRKQFFEEAKRINRYKIVRRLEGELSYADIGDSYHSDILYDRGYNINQLVSDGYLSLIPRIFPFEEQVVGNNRHTVFTVCPECGNHGVNMPLEKACGNCGYTETRTYYDAETIHNYLAALNTTKHQDNG